MQYLFYYLFRALFYLIVAAIFGAVLLSVFSPLDFFGRFKFLVISSASMDPALKIGDLIVVNARPTQINKNDIIVFKDPRGSGFLITHRVKNIFQDGDENFIQTKGDGNNSLDDWQIKPEDIYGKTFLAFPVIGYVLEFAKTFAGFVILIVIPSVVIIANELAKVKLYWERKEVLELK